MLRSAGYGSPAAQRIVLRGVTREGLASCCVYSKFLDGVDFYRVSSFSGCVWQGHIATTHPCPSVLILYCVLYTYILRIRTLCDFVVCTILFIDLAYATSCVSINLLTCLLFVSDSPRDTSKHFRLDSPWVPRGRHLQNGVLDLGCTDVNVGGGEKGG